MPPLRERDEDIVPLAEAFLRKMQPGQDTKLPPDVVAMFKGYGWPGNVRELRNAVGRYALLGARDRADLLPIAETGDGRIGDTGDGAISEMRYHEARQLVIERFERRYFQALLERVGGNISKAAEIAGVSRSTYYRMLERSEGRPPPDDR